MRSRTIEYPVTEAPPLSDVFKQNLERLSRLFAEFEIASPKAGKQAGKPEAQGPEMTLRNARRGRLYRKACRISMARLNPQYRNNPKL